MSSLKRIIARLAFVTVAGVGAVVFCAVVWAASITAEPYRTTAETIDRAPSLDTYPPLLVATFVRVESPDALTHSRFASLRNMWCGMRSRCPAKPEVTSFLIKSAVKGHGAERLVSELLATFAIEYARPPDKILSAYLNEAYLGSVNNEPIHGVKAAALSYFEKPIDFINPAEIALLVGMFKAPAMYSPRTRPAAAAARQAEILELMRGSGLLSEGQSNSSTANVAHVTAQQHAAPDVPASAASPLRQGRG